MQFAVFTVRFLPSEPAYVRVSKVSKIQNKKQIQPDEKDTLDEVKAMMIQDEKDAALTSLLYVSRKLGEVEGVISIQEDPDKAQVDVQEDLKHLYNKLVEKAGVEQVTEPKRVGDCIGGDCC